MSMRLIAVAAVALMGGLLAGGQANPAKGKLYRIAGTLTDSVSGAPLEGATLALSNLPERQNIQNVETDAQGRFSFEPVAAAKYALMAARRGYLSEEFDEHEEYSSAIVTGEGQDTEHIPFRLDPEAVLRGRVTDETGEPVTTGSVLIRQWSRWGGLGEHLEQLAPQVLDDRGEFETWNLRPGKYVAAVMAKPWYAVTQLKSKAAEATSEEERAALAALDVAYPLTYGGSVTDEEATTPITVEAGSVTEMNFTLNAVPVAHLTVRAAPGKSEGGYAAAPAVEQIFFGEEVAGREVFKQIETGGVVHWEYAVAPGRYRVTGGTPVRTMEVNVTGDLDVDLGAGDPTVETTMKVRMADGSPLNKSLEIRLMSGSALKRDSRGRVDEKGEVEFAGLTPGEWVAFPAAFQKELAVVAQERGGKTKADSRIDLTHGQSGITLVVAEGKTGIEGFAEKDGHGQAGVMVVLVPRNPEGNVAEFRRDQSDSDGSFLLRNAVPGEYTVVAIEGGWELDWMKPGVIETYLAAGERVTVKAGDGETVRLREPVRVQKR
jgi:hypothetical protein